MCKVCPSLLDAPAPSPAPGRNLGTLTTSGHTRAVTEGPSRAGGADGDTPTPDRQSAPSPAPGARSATPTPAAALARLPTPPAPGALASALAAAVWSLPLAAAAQAPLTSQRSLLFASAALLYLPGLHRRLDGYLHAPERLRLLPLPLAPAAHWRAAHGAHLRGVVIATAAGLLALALALLGAGAAPTALAALVGDLLWIALMVAVIEPVIPAVAAWGGRRFPADTPASAAQRQLGGGWTAPEAVIHLYAPAFGLGLGLGLAMPGQLALERHGLTAPALPWLLAPLAVALALRLAAPALYARGLWEAIPRLHEATRTLAGPPLPEHAPALLGRLGWALRLDLLQLLRLAPLVGLRLALLVVWTAVVLFRDAAPDPPALALLTALTALWLAPLATLRRQRALRRHLLGALPIPASQRSGALAPATWLLLLTPPFAAAALVALRS